MNNKTDHTAGERILIVDDTTANLQLLTNLLTEQGYVIYPASDGELALEFIRTTLPDLILLDIRMPGMDGYEVCRRLKAEERTANIPIIFISALEDERDKVKGFQAGGVDYITKPFQPEEVLARVRTHLQLHKMAVLLEQELYQRSDELVMINHLLQQELTERKQAEEALRKLNEELEQKVQERTAELVESNVELKQEMEARDHQQKFLEALLENIEAGIVACDDKGILTLFNRKSRELHGLPQTPIPADQWAEYYDLFLTDGKTPMSKEDIPLFRAFQGERVERTEMMIVPRHGEAKTLLASGQVIRDKEGRKIGAVVAMHDITEQKQVEETLRQYREHLEELIKERTVELEAANERLLSELSERKAAEQKLQEQQEFLQRSLDALTHPFYVINIKDYTIALANTASRFHEYPQGTTCYQLTHNRSEPCAGAMCPCPIQEILEKKAPVVFEHCHYDANGTEQYIEVHAYPVFSDSGEVVQIIEYCIDISERRKIEEERLRLTAVMEQTVDSIVITDTKANIQYVNPGFEKTTGYSAAEALGKNPRILQSGRHSVQFYQEMWNTLNKGKVWRGHIINKKKDGSLFNEEVSITPVLDDSGKIINYVAIKRDVTEQKKLAEQLQQAQKMEAIGSLAGGIAHDFNNILSAILGYTELVKEDLDDPESLRRDLAQVLKGAGRAKELVKQILTFSRRGEQELQPLKVQMVIKEALRLLRSSIPTTIEINTDINPDCPPIVADPTQIHQVIMNICTNAYHAMRKTGGILGVSLQPVQFPTDVINNKVHLPPGAYVKLEISDTGSGIPKDAQDRIFEPYYTTKAKGEGTGLGLAVVHGIVTMLQGDIGVYSEVNEGTIFRIYLPVAASAAETRQLETATAPLPMGKEKILVVDDDSSIAEMTTIMLESLGYNVSTLSNSLDAFNTFQQEPDHFDLIITDMTMPDMTGAELARKILTIRPGMKIILCTGYSDLITGDEAKSIGIRDYLMKPVAMKDLAESVRHVLDVS